MGHGRFLCLYCFSSALSVVGSMAYVQQKFVITGSETERYEKDEKDLVAPDPDQTVSLSPPCVHGQYCILTIMAQYNRVLLLAYILNDYQILLGNLKGYFKKYHVQNIAACLSCSSGSIKATKKNISNKVTSNPPSFILQPNSNPKFSCHC